MSRCEVMQWRLLIRCGLVEHHGGRHIGVGTYMGLRCRAAWTDLRMWRLGPVWRGRERHRYFDLSAGPARRLP